MNPNQPQPNTIYNHPTLNASWRTNSQGLTDRVEFSVTRLAKGKRNNYQQRKANRKGLNRQIEDYEGGHPLADQFGFDAEAVNLVPMLKCLNQGNYKIMENFWHRRLEEGHIITNGIIEIQYITNTQCPAFIDVSYIVNGRSCSHHFVNDSAFNCWGERDMATAFL
jgi:hypothetical protein